RRLYDPWIILEHSNGSLRHLKLFSLLGYDTVTVLPTEESTVSKISAWSRQSLNVALSLTKLTSQCHRSSASYLIIWCFFGRNLLLTYDRECVHKGNIG
ncbi:hypothetical protein ALC53_11470, partial [Atta colombica]